MLIRYTAVALSLDNCLAQGQRLCNARMTSVWRIKVSGAVSCRSHTRRQIMPCQYLIIYERLL